MSDELTRLRVELDEARSEIQQMKTMMAQEAPQGLEERMDEGADETDYDTGISTLENQVD